MDSLSNHKNAEAFSEVTGLSEEEITSILRRFHVRIDVGSPISIHSDEWVQTYLLLNLLPRIFDKVSIQGCDPTKHFPPPLIDRVSVSDFAKANLTLAVGGEPSNPGESVLYVGNRGWVVYLSYEGPWKAPKFSQNPIAAYYAAALSVGEVFKIALRDQLEQSEATPSPYFFDIYNMRETTGPQYEPEIARAEWDLGDLLVVGLGAVGQAFIDAVSLVPNLSGMIQLVDPDHSDEGNEQRCVFAFPPVRNHMKVDLCWNIIKERQAFVRVKRNQTIFSRTLVSGIIDGETATTVIDQSVAAPFRQDYRHFRQTAGASRAYPIVVCAVDSAHTRRDIQFGLHKVILNGWTRTKKAGLEYGIGRHQISNGRACMACRYHPDREQPEFADFVARRTGWTVGKVLKYLGDDTLLLTEEDIRGIASFRRVPIDAVADMEGKPLRVGVHEQCGAFQVTGQSQSNAPVPYLAVLTGAILATAVLRELNGDGEIVHLFQTDAKRYPTNYSIRMEEPNPDCLCCDHDIQYVYHSKWEFK